MSSKIQHHKIISLKNQKVIADKALVANSFSRRFIGLMNRVELLEGEAMIFPRCSSVHTWFMKITIDIVFVKMTEDQCEVVKIFKSVKPWRLFPVSSVMANSVIELPNHSIQKYDIKNGDILCIA